MREGKGKREEGGEGKGKKKEKGEGNSFVFQRYHTKRAVRILRRFWHLSYLECKCRQW